MLLWVMGSVTLTVRYLRLSAVFFTTRSTTPIDTSPPSGICNVIITIIIIIAAATTTTTTITTTTRERRPSTLSPRQVPARISSSSSSPPPPPPPQGMHVHRHIPTVSTCKEYHHHHHHHHHHHLATTRECTPIDTIPTVRYLHQQHQHHHHHHHHHRPMVPTQCISKPGVTKETPKNQSVQARVLALEIQLHLDRGWSPNGWVTVTC